MDSMTDFVATLDVSQIDALGFILEDMVTSPDALGGFMDAIENELQNRGLPSPFSV
jgi:hypothetical protein